MEGTFRGILNVDGQPFQAQGTVTQHGADLTVVLSLSSGLEARGEGRVEGRAVRMELGYRSECPGTLLLEGALAEEDERLAGRLEARDCTGEARGSFQLDRQRNRSVAGSSRR